MAWSKSDTFAPVDDEAEGVAQRVARKVHLGREAGLGAAHGLGELPTDRPRGVLVDSRAGAVDHQILLVTSWSADRDQQRLPKPALGPATERRVDAFPRTEHRRQIPPGCPGPQDPQDRLDAQALVRTFAATPPRADQFAPMAVNFFSSPQVPSLKANLICWFTGACDEKIGESSRKSIQIMHTFSPSAI